MTTVGANVPAALAARLAEHARQHRLTVSLLLRTLVERELEADPTQPMGPCEATTRARLEQLLDPDALDPRASICAELARRLDTDPASGAQHSVALMKILEDVEQSCRAATEHVTPLGVFQARHRLRLAGYGMTDPDGKVLCLHSEPRRHRAQDSPHFTAPAHEEDMTMT